MPETPKHGNPQTPDLANLGARLRTARERKGMSQTEVAKRFERTQSWLGRIENGRIDISVTDLADLAELYGYSVEWFIHPEGQRRFQPITPRTRADWEFLYPEDEERARAHAEIDSILERARKGSGRGTSSEGSA